MNRRKFLQFLGIGAPAAAVAAVVAPKLLSHGGESFQAMEARLGEYHTYYSESDPQILKALDEHAALHNENIYFDRELLDNLKRENHDLYMSAISRNVHVGTPVKREFFQYNVRS